MLRTSLRKFIGVILFRM